MSTTGHSNLFDLTTATPPALSCAEAVRIAREHFDVSGSARALTSERDQNFHLSAADGREFVLKFANPREDPNVTDFQTRALLHVASRDPDFPLPRVCTTTRGATETTVVIGQDQTCVVRLLTYLPGVPLGEVPSTPRLRCRLGQHLARLGRALADFSHPAENREILWDMKHAAHLAELIPKIQDAEQRSTTARIIENFRDRVLPRFEKLRGQVIYNDLNPSNVLMDADDPERIVGIIDFGDMVRSPLVVDVAVGATYQLRHTADPFEAATQFVAAYHAVYPLEQRETDLLFDLVATRLAMSVIISTWRATLYPENRDYIMRNVRPNRVALKHLNDELRTYVQERLRAACP